MKQIGIVFLVLAFSFNKNEAWNSINVMSNVQVTFRNRGQQTDFIVESSFGNGVYVSNAWVGIGLNSRANVMGGSSVVVCKNSGDLRAVQHYYNRGHRSSLLNSNDPSLGITNAQINVNETHMKCEYTRENSMADQSGYFDLENSSPYLTAAFGQGKVLFYFILFNKIIYFYSIKVHIQIIEVTMMDCIK